MLFFMLLVSLKVGNVRLPAEGRHPVRVRRCRVPEYTLEKPLSVHPDGRNEAGSGKTESVLLNCSPKMPEAEMFPSTENRKREHFGDNHTAEEYHENVLARLFEDVAGSQESDSSHLRRE